MVQVTVYQDAYDLATDCGAVTFCRRYGFQEPLRVVGPEEMYDVKGFDTSEGQPQIAAIFEHDTSGDPTTQRQLWVHPFPDIPYRVEVYYRQSGNIELSGTARPLIPDEYAQVLIYGALARGYAIFLNDTERASYFQQLFNDIIGLMVAQARRHEGYPQISPRDSYRGF